MKKIDKSMKTIIALIIVVFAFIIGLVVLIKLGVIKVSASNLKNTSYLDNVKKEELCQGIWYYYDEGISAYILVDETGTERQKVDNKEDLEYYKEDPNRLFENNSIFYIQDEDETAENIIEE